MYFSTSAKNKQTTRKNFVALLGTFLNDVIEEDTNQLNSGFIVHLSLATVGSIGSRDPTGKEYSKHYSKRGGTAIY